jgi:hypothetical protein
MPEDIENLLRQLIGGDADAPAAILDRAATSCSPVLLVAAALLTDQPDGLLASAAQHATTTRDRQLTAVAAAHLHHDDDLLDALVRDHLADYPDSLLAAWIAAKHTRQTTPPTSTTRSHHA